MSASATIRRGSAPARGRAGPARGKSRARPPVRPSLGERLGIDPALVQRATTWGLMGLMLAALAGLAVLLGVPAYIADKTAQAIGHAGFAVKRIDVSGIRNMNRLTVYAIALDQNTRAMPLVDLERVRGELMRYGWIEDARVSRRLPDTLVIDIVERTPAAVWQNQGRLMLIDAHGIVLDDAPVERMPDLPLVVGPDANVQTTALTELLAHAPRLKPLVAGATWVGNRRWDIRMQSGETVMLPEGAAEAARALALFDRLDDRQRLMGRGFLRFDLRDGRNMIIKLNRNRPQIDRPDAPAPGVEAPGTGGAAPAQAGPAQAGPAQAGGVA